MKKNLLILSLLLFSVAINAQKIKVKSGSLNTISSPSKMDVVFDYSNMGVGEFNKESDYVAEKVEKYNQDEPGKGDTWKENWINDRKERFEPKFLELFNKHLAEVGIFADYKNTDSKYILEIHTTFTEPGFNVYMARKNASINAEVVIKEKSTGNSIATLSIENCPGRGATAFDFDSGTRVAEAYAKLGKAVSKMIANAISK